MEKELSDEEIEKRLAYANAMDDEDGRHLDEIRELFIEEFKRRNSPLDYFDIIPEDDDQFRAYIFFMKDSDISESEENGVKQSMVDYVYQQLEHFGRGKRHEIAVEFEFDSRENVEKNFEGSYLVRMH